MVAPIAALKARFVQAFFSPRYRVVIFYDGPRTQWMRSTQTVPRIAEFVNDATGIKPPDATEVLKVAEFRYRWRAIGYAIAMTKMLDRIRVDVVTLGETQ